MTNRIRFPRRLRRLLCCLALCGLALPCAAHPHAARDGCMQGRVFEDRDGDGRASAAEPGLPDVAISDGERLVRTGADGRYRLCGGRGPVFVIQPAGLAVARDPATGLPAGWWHAADASATADFALRRRAGDGKAVHCDTADGGSSDGASSRDPGGGSSPGAGRSNGAGSSDAGSSDGGPNVPPLRILVTADPQPKTGTDLDYYRRDIVADAAARGGDFDLRLVLGDLVNDRLDLYPQLLRADARLPGPGYYVPGNHDLDAGARDDAGTLATFHRRFGPDTFALETRQADIVGLDDVIAMPGEKPAYVGGLRESQFAFLEAYLPTLPRDRLLVLALHIPLFDAADAAPGQETFRHADRARLFALLQSFPRVLVLSGHSHTQRMWLHGADEGWRGEAPLREYNVGAACGAYWSGVRDAAGIPDSTMADGTPNGWATLTVEPGGDYRLAWHPARDAADTAIGLHAPRVLRQGAYPAWGVYANVYMGEDGSRVEFRVDGGDWRPMTRVLQPDPALLVENMRDDLADTLRGYDRSPEATASPHLWRGALPTTLPAGRHRVEVRAFDRWLGERRAATDYRLELAPP